MKIISSIRELALGDVMGIRVISFDLWMTLITPNPASKIARTKIVASYLGIKADEALTHLLGSVSLDLDRKSESTGLDFTCADRINSLCAHLRLPMLPPPQMRDLVERIQQGILNNMPTLVVKDTQEVLLALKSQGVHLALMSNTGYPQGVTMRKVLQALGIAECFNTLIFSDEQGVAKPSSVMYEKVLRTFSIEPREMLHVGDSLVADYRGAEALGIHARLFKTTNP